MSILIEYEAIIRTVIFLTLFILLACGEFLFPLAKRKCTRIRQWFINLSIVIIDNISLNLLLPLLAVGVAQYAAAHSLGVFNMIAMPAWLAIILSLLLLDLLIYGQHVLMHRVPLLWKLHRMHHTELGLDVSSAVRFHPLEIIISMLIKMLFVLLLGIPVAAVIIFEVLLNGLALFNHSNLKLNKRLDSLLRILFVTPEVHWVHHSQIVKETNSNYGFNLIIWDKLFATYTAKPKFDYPQMQQGLREFNARGPLTITELLLLPFNGERH